MKGVYIALITIVCVVVVAGIGVGIYFGIKATQKSGPPPSVSTSCASGTICNGVCCNASTVINGKCICEDSCPVVGVFNDKVFCCRDPNFANVVDDQCCNSDNTTCIAGTPLT